MMPSRSSQWEDTPETHLRQIIECLSSLIDLSKSVKVFAVKWQPIRAKLEELRSVLASMEEGGGVQGNPAFSRLMSAVMSSVTEGFDLVRRCVDLSYSGKLLMQSDLDIILAKFDLHSRSLSGMRAAGVVAPGCAIVVPRPASGACKEEMRFYVRDLLGRLKIGDAEMRRQALVSLRETISENEKYVRIVVEVGGVVSVLVGFLDLSDREVQEEAAKVVSLIAGFDSFKSVLIGAGVVSALIMVLECGSFVGKEASLACLAKLTENSDNAWSVSAHGGVIALMKICSSAESDPRLIHPACGVLKNLVGVHEIKSFMIEGGVIQMFISLLRSRDDNVRIGAMEILQAMASGDERTRQLIINGGGIRSLMRILDPSTTVSSRSREVVLVAVEKLCFSSATSIKTLIGHRFLDFLLYFLQRGEVPVQELALKVSAKLCAASEEANKAMGVAGFMPEFVGFLDSKSSEVRATAAEALSIMVLVPKSRKRFIQEDHHVSTLLRVLDLDDGNSGIKQSLISTLLAITRSSVGRRKVINSGYMKSIEKLAEGEVQDAKRLTRKLSTNRLRTMLSGIWYS
ncbi:hypothetical protein MLD38_016770 [Melastoma candidum]|uniref:Uncharacterized protein n=1 Tax=Melastoma candidum TaxID=119954 RepID=A0ACB9QPN7_9MYRT|nr:hypothetical protein MLD38_016770 [Melastoma candidum]